MKDQLFLILSLLFFCIPLLSMESLLLPKGNILKPEVIAALIYVQKQLSKQKLGLKM